MPKRDREATRARLLEAARLRFAREGYDATSVRDIAGDVGVDATLIFRYFGSKKGLFDEVTADIPRDLLDGPPEELVARMLESVVFADWTTYGGEHPLVAMLRSSAHEEARQRIRKEVCDTYVRALEDLARGEDAQLRAELLSAWLVGIGILRSVVATPALAQAGAGDLAPHVQSVASALLGRPMSGNSGMSGQDLAEDDPRSGSEG
ncbi:TetR family transcriptional regulator [Nonomuraea phyllanthi]|uniref:TetR family transcriptional regulator n=1 Tax=Nonomuraea phyllanthi TaxID=2219224 RepID=A0A5C4VT08_9ACTN|nr:TetR/AcrR family transcriptional regulator [Nonomuraea phyllanthi]KAB8189961.1 TetR family transcriptional regulator [Nonomuraea phyllanthi]QFY08452.1 TetR family transcriptional regulator [Nonomuraea phyllanthi]